MEKNNNNNNNNNNNYNHNNNNNNNNAQQMQSWQNYRNENGSYYGHMKSDGVEPPTNRRWWYTALDVLVFLITCIGIILRSLFYGIVGRPVKDLRPDIALITGGGAGMGRMLAQRLAKLGTKVVIWDINSAGIKDTVREVEEAGGFCKGYVVDISDREAVYKAADVVRRDVGNVTLLINNAGVANSHYLLDTPDHVIERTFRVNSMAHFWTTKTFLPSMIENGRGHIVTIASIAGLAGAPQLVDYCATKHAAIGFDDALRVELASLGVRGVITTCICPFFMQPTNLFDNISAKWMPILESNDVADRTIRAIQRGETRVIIPWHMNFNLPFKWIFPWQCYVQAQQRIVPNMPYLPVEAAAPLPKRSLIFQRPPTLNERPL